MQDKAPSKLTLLKKRLVSYLITKLHLLHNFLKTNSVAIAIHRSRKDIILILFVALPLLLIGVIALAHTLNVLIFFGGKLVINLLLPLFALTLATLLVVQRNAVHSLLCLMGVFLCITGIYFSVGASYFALVFLLVGQGGVAVIFLHAVLFLPLRATLSATSAFKLPSQIVATAAGVLGFLYLLIELSSAHARFFLQNEILLTRTEKSSVDRLRYYVNFEANDVLVFVKLYTQESALFMLITLILLCGMLGSIILATSSVDEETFFFRDSL